MSRSSHILVTGGAGFIGSHLVERLLATGKQVVVLDDLSTGRRANLDLVADNPHFRFWEGKVSQCPDPFNLVAEAEFIFHLAAAVGVEMVVNAPIHTIHTNLHETEAIVEAASHSSVPLFLASTSEVYGKSQKPAFTETDDLLIGPPYLGRWRYACSKLMDEFIGLAYAQERALPVTIGRLFNTVGPRQTGRYGMVLPRFIAAARLGKPLRVFGDGSQTRCFSYVLDTVEALLRLNQCPAARGEVFNIGSSEEVTILELAKLVIQTLNSPSTIEFIPYEQAYSPGFEDMLRRKPVTDKLFNAIGYRPQTPLQQIIELTAAAGSE